jgi:hypothetical protein
MERYVQNDIKTMGIITWRRTAQDLAGWRTATGEVLILLGEGEEEEEEKKRYNYHN